MERAYGWDEPPVETPNESSGEFLILEPGIYRFAVLKMVRATYDGSAKLPPCKKAEIHCLIETNAGGTVIKNNLYLHSKCDGLLCAFFASIGLRQHGDPLVFRWNEIEGKRGLCNVKHRNGTGKYEGKVFNEIDRFLEPDDNAKALNDMQPETPHTADAATETTAQGDFEENIPF